MRPLGLGWPNIISVARILLAPILVLLVLADDRTAAYVAAAVFVVGAATDGLDGYLARRHAATTRLGQWLDPVADKALVAAAIVTLTVLGRFPLWAAVLIVVRELGVSVLRAWLGTRGRPMPASWLGKLKTGAQMLAVLLYLLPLPDAASAARFGVLVVAIVLESFSMRTAVIESNHARGEQGWWQFIRHARAPELPVVLLEDLGALLGLVFALVGVLVAHLTGEPRWDAVGSIAIGVLLLVIAIVLMIEMKSLLIGESARPADVRRITEELRSGPNIAQVLEVRTQHIGPEELIVGAKVALEPGLTVEQIARSIDTTEANIRRSVPAARHLYVEPDL